MKNTKKNNETAKWKEGNERIKPRGVDKANHQICLLYTSDAADER